MVRRKPRLERRTSNKTRTRMHRDQQKILMKREERVNQLLHQSSELEMTQSTASNNDENGVLLRNQIRDWVNENRIAKRAVNSLLSILISAGEESLPRDYRTLLQTPCDIEITSVAGGQLWYSGLSKNLRMIFCSLDRDLKIALNFNIDGLPLFNNSKTEFYPILASIHGIYFPSVQHASKFGEKKSDVF